MSRRPRPPALPPRSRVWLVVLVGWTIVAAGCGGGSTDSAGPADTSRPVRTEPASGRGTDAVDSAPEIDPTSEDDPTDGSGEPDPSAEPGSADDESAPVSDPATGVRTGAQVLVDESLAPLQGRRVGLIANRASMVDGRRLIDILHEAPEVELVALFAPEHGLAALGAAGAEVADGVDATTGITIHSLYGSDRAPTPAALAGLDVLVFDLQDVGARFYTYTATLGLALQAAARAQVPVVVLDRPNPLGGERPDGPIRADGFESFVSLLPVPALHGMTTGELALAIRGESWLDGVGAVDLEVVELQGWDRGQRWDDTGLAWSPPSPGLPTAELSLLYPATVLLEATTLSFGRGTDRPFGQFGAPWLDADALAAELRAAGLAGVGFEATTFTPADGTEPIPGVRLVVTDPSALRPLAVGVHVLDRVLAQAGDREVIDRPDFLDLLAGSADLRRDLVAGRDPAEIVASWSEALATWETTRAPYLLYPSAS